MFARRRREKIAKISSKSRFFIRVILDLLRFQFLNNYPTLVLGDLEQGGVIVIWNRSDILYPILETEPYVV